MPAGSKLRDSGVAILRLSLAGWLFTTLFFVAVAIRPIRAPELDSLQKAFLAGVLFPGYYAFGFTLLATGWLATILTRPPRWRILLGVVTLALTLAIVDWFLIYSVLAEMTHRQWTEQTAAPASFRGYHVASMTINGVGMVCTAVAALLACLNGPAQHQQTPQ